MIRNILVTFLFCFSLYSQASNIEAKIEYNNPSDKINDGEARVIVEGGEPPYQYKWSLQQVNLSSNKANGLVEGEPFKILITDAKGNSKTIQGMVPTRSVEEKMNSTFKPIVDAMANFLFWDPFSAIGIYDPTVYEDVRPVKTPG